MELNKYHCIGNGKIIHKRTRDTKNFFHYNAPYLCLNLNRTKKIHPLISLNRFNFFSIFYKQHGYRDKNKNLLCFAYDIAAKYNIKFDRVSFISIPSTLGYSFNPISFYLYLNTENKLVAIIYEVKNTFGDQVHYLSLGDFSNKKFKKNMYVSPFIEMDCHYKISVRLKDSFNFFCAINQFDKENKQIFYASIDLELKKIKSLNVFIFLFLNILGSIKTIALIHYQAVKLFMKKSKFFKYSHRIKDKLYLD